MAVNWKNIGLPRWYDWKLGRMKDQQLATLVGTTKKQIWERRMALGIAAYTVDQKVEPFRDLLGIETDRYVARLSGVSEFTVTAYRKDQGIPARPRPFSQKKPHKRQGIPAGHPVKPYKVLLGLVSDEDIARLAGVPVATVEALRKAFDLQPAAPLPEPQIPDSLPNYQGPWLGYESLFGTMSAAKISRAVGVPFSVVERRQEFLGVPPYQRVSRVERYKHLVGVISDGVLAKLAGVSPSRIQQIRKLSQA